MDAEECEHDYEVTSDFYRGYAGEALLRDIECKLCGKKDKEVYKFVGYDSEY